jgi:hypothetical protein
MPLCERSATPPCRVAMAPLQRCTLQQLSARNESDDCFTEDAGASSLYCSPPRMRTSQAHIVHIYIYICSAPLMPLCERSATPPCRVAMAPLQRCTLQQLSARNESDDCFTEDAGASSLYCSPPRMRTSQAHLLCPPQVSARAVFFPLSLFLSKRKAKMPQQLCATRNSNAAR